MLGIFWFKFLLNKSSQVKSSLFYRNIQNAQKKPAKDNSVT